MDLTTLFDPDTDDGGVRLHGSRCPSCGAAAFPARLVCGLCHARDLAPEEMPARGRVRCSTPVPTPPFGFDGSITVGVVELAAGPSLFALISEPLPRGAAVAARPAPVRSGAPGFVFGPIGEYS